MVSPTGKVLHDTPILKKEDTVQPAAAPCFVRTAKTWELIKAHSESGLTVKQIAEKMGISEITIAHAAKNHGFKLHDESGEINGATYISRHNVEQKKPETLQSVSAAVSRTVKRLEKAAQENIVRINDDDNVNHPAHYMLPGGGEAIDFIEDVCGEGVDEYYRGNILKYICRYKEKGGAESLKKARWYLDRLIVLQKEREAE